MKNSRKFLVPLAVLASMFATDHAFATVKSNSDSIEPNATDAVNVAAKDVLIMGDSQKLFKFILRRNEKGTMVADHYSHESHASHASHSSHYSGS
ncbi:MAG: hypothetical protein HO274_00500 [Ferrovum myxofaciens]|uniref:His-Xaa-Ser repeat protein HxsA2 n=1 Tax=Ferrovum myxofaciens TaxID=416213 RepID=UPI002353E909|nr:His-Xaa-Ser repeat protein HxsA2 [Ferrovum myxofaciens]QKE39980.1 MAG: hypothetical protein HO274_00500 [Ferrovum myxofaciens]